jgi:hypothetical protein
MEEFRMFEKILRDNHEDVITQFRTLLTNDHITILKDYWTQYEYKDAYFFIRDEKYPGRHCKLVKSNDSKKYKLFDYMVQKHFNSFEEWATDCGCTNPSLSDIKYGRNNEHKLSYNLSLLICVCKLYEKSCMRMLRKACDKNPKLTNKLYDILNAFADTD